MSQFLIIPDRENMGETLALAKEYNLGLELNEFMYPSVLDDTQKCIEIAQFYKKSGGNVLTSHGDFFDVLVFSEDKRIAEISKLRIMQSIEVSAKAGAKAVIFHSNIEPFLTGDVYRENWCNKNEEVFREICKKYPDMNVYMENMFDTRPYDLANLGERMKDVKNFGICFDYAHAYLSNTFLSEWAKVLSPYIKHVHINDNDKAGDWHWALGDGTIDWTVFARLREMYFPEATVLIEMNSIESQLRSLEYLQSINLI